MTTQDSNDRGHKDVLDAPEHFFRELEIEFLLHELKDPISIIETGMRTLLEKQDKYGSLSARQEKTLKRSLRNTKKVREMVNGLLEIGRTEVGRFVCCRFKPAMTVSTVIVDSLEIMGQHLPEHTKNIKTIDHMEQMFSRQGIFLEIASQVRETEMLQDEIKFRQILGNLIKNALFHRKERIEIALSRNGEHLIVDVTDDGPGIEPEHHQAIFQRYAQIQENPSARKGHGLGLAGALILARGLGGNIEVNSTKGQGATFRLSLPVVFERSV